MEDTDATAYLYATCLNTQTATPIGNTDLVDSFRLPIVVKDAQTSENLVWVNEEVVNNKCEIE